MTPRRRRDRLNSIQQIAAQLRESDDVAAPDLTSSILSRVDEARPFLNEQTRRMIWVSRIALASSVAGVVLASTLIHRLVPAAAELVSGPAPLSSVVESVKFNATERLVVLREAMASPDLSSVGAGEEASPASFDAEPSGGLLTLVTSAAPVSSPAPIAVSRSKHSCALCGPLLPPARAAQLIPNSTSTQALSIQPLSLSAAKSTLKFSTSLERTRLPGRAEWASSSAAAGPSSRIVLDELAPLGVGAAGESALAPK